MELILEYLAKGFLVMLAITMPCICTAAAIGLVVGILQAVTQVQEQTIAAAPKVLGVFLVILMGGVGFTRMLSNIFIEGMDLAFNGVSKGGNYVLDADYFKYTKPFSDEMKQGSFKNTQNVDKIMKNPQKTPFLENQAKTKFYPANKEVAPSPNLMERKKMKGD